MTNEEYDEIYCKIIARFPQESEYLQILKDTHYLNKEDRYLIELIKRSFRGKLETQKVYETRLRPMPPVFFQISNSMKIDAAAIPLPPSKKNPKKNNPTEGMAITVTYGLVLKIHEIFHRAFCDPEFLPDLGDASLEESFHSDISLSNRISFSEVRRSRCPIRAITATYMTLRVVEFVVLHEYRHLLAGHALFLKRTSSSRIIRETGNNYLPSELLSSQICEWAADHYGSSNAIFSAYLMHKIHTKHIGEPLGAVLNNLDQAFLLSSIGIYAFFRVLESQEGKASNWDASAHPPALVRLLLIMVSGSKILSHYFSYSPEAAKKLSLDRTVINTEKALLLSGYSLPSQSLDMKHEVAHAEKIEDLYHLLHPQIQNFSYVELHEESADRILSIEF